MQTQGGVYCIEAYYIISSIQEFSSALSSWILPRRITHLDGRSTPCLDDEQSQEFGRQFDRIVGVSLLGMMQPEALPREARRDRRRGGRRTTTTTAFPPRAAVPPVVGRRA